MVEYEHTVTDELAATVMKHKIESIDKRTWVENTSRLGIDGLSG
jgi:hypothetical protein